MKISHVEQGSPAWHDLRLGIPTASEFHLIMTPKKRKLSDSAPKYLNHLLAEWMTGAELESFEGGWMERGKALEPKAVQAYEFLQAVDASTVGFITTDDGMIGASPDRLIGDVGLYEGKAPAAPTHVGHMVNRALDEKHITQVQGQLWVSEREWCDIHSFYPGLPSVIIRAYRDEEFIKDLSACVRSFVDVMLATRAKLVQEYGELRRERVTAQQRTAASHAAFEEFMASGIGGAV